MNNRLIDLDELTLRCKDAEARTYISEAVACYKSGAIRSCIVATWIAVVYDFVHKLRELERSGDRNATEKLKEFEKARQSNTPTLALAFEKNILVWARDDFEFLSPVQYEDLLRLLQDRNRCAHPSMISADEIYEPPAELARYHLRNAITHLLEHAPVQGQAALDRLMNDVASQYFPVDSVAAIEYFRHGPLVNAKVALVRNFVILLLKSLLLETHFEPEWNRFLSALRAVRQMYREETDRVFSEHLSRIVLRLSDNKLVLAVQLIASLSDVWQYLEGDIKTKLKTYIETVDEDAFSVAFFESLMIPQLKAAALERLTTLSETQLATLIAERPIPEFAERAIILYSNSSSFPHANRLASELILPMMSAFNLTHLEKIISAAIPRYRTRYPNQIYESTEFRKHVLPQIKASHNLSDEQFSELIRPLQEAHPDEAYFWEQYFGE